MITRTHVEATAGVRETQQDIALNDLTLECDVLVTTWFEGLDGAGAPQWHDSIDAAVTHVVFHRCQRLSYRYAIDEFTPGMRAMFDAWANDHIDDHRRDILERIF